MASIFDGMFVTKYIFVSTIFFKIRWWKYQTIYKFLSRRNWKDWENLL